MATAAAADFFDKDTPHGYVKRVMWYKYLQAFIAKTQQSRSANIDTTIICDVFAGSGLYTGWGCCSTPFTDYGSPLVAIRAAIEYFVRKNNLPNTFEPRPGAHPDYDTEASLLEEYKIDLHFVEKDRKNYKSLVENIILFFNFHEIPVHKSPQAPNQVCVSSIDEDFPICCYISNCEFVEFTAPDVPDNARMVTFIDPFGYAMIPWQKVSEFVGQYKELFINLMTSFMNRFFKKNCDKISEVFGIEVEVLQTLRFEDKSNFVDTLVDLYVEKLDSHFTGLDLNYYALTFELRNISNARLYHLIFASSHIEGLKSMKESFNRGTQEPDTFSLSDYKILRKNIPLKLGNEQDPKEVAKVIFDKFKGRVSVSIKEIEMFVWRDTPYVYRKKPLAKLEKDEKIVKVVGSNHEIRQRRYTFPDGVEWLISFATE